MEKYINAEKLKQECLDKGIFPVFIKNTIEKQSEEGHLVKETDLLLTYDPKNPDKPYLCTNCSTRYNDFNGINFCSSCGAKVNKVF